MGSATSQLAPHRSASCRFFAFNWKVRPANTRPSVPSFGGVWGGQGYATVLNKRSRIVIDPPSRVIQNWADSGPSLIEFYRCRTTSDFGPDLSEYGPLVDFGRLLVQIGRNRRKFGRIRAKLGRIIWLVPGKSGRFRNIFFTNIIHEHRRDEPLHAPHLVLEIRPPRHPPHAPLHTPRRAAA